MNDTIRQHLQQLQLPDSASHKGQNGKLLLIGGSELFHAASKWSLDIASKFVDMVFYASVPSNNELIHQAKGEFWNGMVIRRDQIEEYLAEADCVLIGPGMERVPETADLTNELLARYADKKWVIDAGALQMVEPHRLNQHCIITPHHGEYDRLLEKIDRSALLETGVTLVLKGPVDEVTQGQTQIVIEGGHPGMTKGGTGDVLAGLIAGLYCTQPALTAAVVGSYINKKAGEHLAEKVGPFFNASELVTAIPEVLWQELNQAAAT